MRELLGASAPLIRSLLCLKEKHTDYHNEVNCRLQGRGDGPKATLVISGPGPRAPLLLISALARPIERS